MNSTTKEMLFHVLDIFDALSVPYWLDGGWGVDALFGEQTRAHRDIDIDFDAAHTDEVMEKLNNIGYVVKTNWLPVRAELMHPNLGYLDIHPFVIDRNAIKQATPEGDFWEFPREFFDEAVFESRKIPCISLAGQKAFHSGYKLREQDLQDLKILRRLEHE